MISTSTFLLTGAGTSIPFGYPSGPKLVSDILLTLDESRNWSFDLTHGTTYTQKFLDYKLYIDAGFLAMEIEKFRKALASANLSSIDAFLEHRKEFKEIGKFAIANVILKYEDPYHITKLIGSSLE